MEWDAGGERRGEQGIWGEGEGDEINCSQWTTNASFVFLPLSFTVGPSISFVTTIYRQSLPSTVLSHPHSLLFFAFFWISWPVCALFPSPGMADRDPWVRPAGCGRHAAGQQGETLLPTLGDGWTDGLIEGGIMEGGVGGVYRLDLWMCLEAGKEIFTLYVSQGGFSNVTKCLGRIY